MRALISVFEAPGVPDSLWAAAGRLRDAHQLCLEGEVLGQNDEDGDACAWHYLEHQSGRVTDWTAFVLTHDVRRGLPVLLLARIEHAADE